MKELEVSSQSTKKPQTIKENIKKELEEPTVDCKRHDNMGIDEKAKTVKRPGVCGRRHSRV